MIEKILLSPYWDIFPLLAIPLAAVTQKHLGGSTFAWAAFVLWALTFTLRRIKAEMKK